MKFNEKITAFFLANARLTFLAFVLLILFAVTSTLLLKTSGFPSPEVNFALVQTPYLGAASETILEDVTIPLEGAIKNVEGVKSYSSKSLNSFSMINLTLDESEDQSKILSELTSAIATVQLPAGAEEPELVVPDIAGSDFMFSIVAENKRATFEAYQEIEKELNSLSETSKVNPLFPLERSVVVRLNATRMVEYGIPMEEVQAKLQTLGLSIPVAADLNIEDDQVSLVTSTEESSLEALKELPFGEHVLTDFATVSLRYEYENGPDPVLAYQGEVMDALTFEIYAADGIDMNDYTEKIETLFAENDDWVFLNGDELPEEKEGQVLLIENYSINEQNQVQVREVLSGIVGGPLPIDSDFKYLGYALGGIQLVFLVMMVFVSWRAALVSALAIPLSLVFSNIYLFLIGESLNTLVLFSFVLVVGLVVDPALVLLEGVQRKLDAGFRGKTAALEAVKDVGNGLFLATLNNIIVFFPFAVVSGILGQIIWYIPLTIMPALVGSYVVPLVFLTWMGSYFLKPRPNKTSDEMENLWGISKAVGKINRWILNTPVFIRGVFIIVALIVPLFIAGSLFGSGQVKSVQFSGSKNADFLMLSGSYLPTTSEEERELLIKNVLETMSEEESIEQISQAFPDLMYYVTLKPAVERKGTISSEIAEELNKEIQDKYGRLFFDIQVGVISNGPPAANYQIALSLKSEDLEELEVQALALGEVLDEACMVNSEIVFEENCSGEKLVSKVDNGYTKKTSPVIEVLLDDEHSTLMPFVNQQLRSLFGLSAGTANGKITIEGDETEVFLVTQTKQIDSMEELEESIILTPTGPLELQDIAEINEVEPKASIDRLNGETIGIVQARLHSDYQDPANAALISQAVIDEYSSDSDSLEIELYSEGDLASFTKSFQELFMALILAILLIYIVLAVFFESFLLPFVVLYSIPLTFVGVFPALVLLGGGEFGFLEIIGLIILVGLVGNLAIFMIDLAKQKIAQGMDEKQAIIEASAVRFRPVLLTKLTVIASLTPLAILSDQYRSLAIVILFGLLTSGITSLFTTPVLFIFFRNLSRVAKKLVQK